MRTINIVNYHPQNKLNDLFEQLNISMETDQNSFSIEFPSFELYQKGLQTEFDLILFLGRMGFNVVVSKNYDMNHTLTIDKKFFTQR